MVIVPVQLEEMKAMVKNVRYLVSLLLRMETIIGEEVEEEGFPLEVLEVMVVLEAAGGSQPILVLQVP